MQTFYKILGLSALSIGLIACNEDSAKKLTLDSATQKASYSYGVDVATRLKQQGIDLDISALNQGIADAYNGSKLALTGEEQVQAKTSFQEELRKKLTAEASVAGEKNSD